MGRIMGRITMKIKIRKGERRIIKIKRTMKAMTEIIMNRMKIKRNRKRKRKRLIRIQLKIKIAKKTREIANKRMLNLKIVKRN